MVRAVDWQSKGWWFESRSLLYKSYWWVKYWLTTSQMAQA